MGGYGQGIAASREMLIPMEGQSPLPAMGQALTLAGLLQGQQEQRQLFPGQMQLQQQRIRGNQMALDQAAQQQQQAQQDSQEFQRLFQDSGGDPEKIHQGLYDPSYHMSWQARAQADAELQQTQAGYAKLDEAKRNRLLQDTDVMRGSFDAVDNASDDQKPVVWANERAKLIRFGVEGASQLPEMFPGEDWLRQHDPVLNFHSASLKTKADYIPVAPGGTLVDPATGKPVYTAPEKPTTPVPGRDVPFPPAVQQQKIDIARQSRPPKEPADKGVNLIVPGPNGQPQIMRAQPGDVLPQGAVTPQQYGSTVTPTSQIRTQAENAQQMVRLIDTITPQIDALDKRGMLGPMAGRYQDFMRGKVGAGDPDYTALKTLNELSQTLALQAHMGSRGAVQVLDKFNAMFDAGKMDAPTLKAAYKAARQYFADRAQSGQIKGWGQNQQGAQQPNITHVWTPNGLQAVGGNQ
jgi:hypothetical protein